MMTDAMTLAYINLYGILGAIPAMLEISPEAKKILGKGACSIGFAIKDGPSATLSFAGGRCILKEGTDDCTVKLPFSSAEKFNGLIDGTVTPVPTKGFTKLPFLLGKFTKLTDLLTRYLRSTEEDMADPDFARISTTLMFGVISRAIVQIGNHDRVGKASASYIVDGVIRLGIENGPAFAIQAKKNRLASLPKVPEKVTSMMTFRDMDTARALFDGKINAVASIGTGDVRMAGMISQIDNVNRILDRVALYLA
ncbi:MAG: hypothetical protein E7631_10155 [Ruminococcaceae bacterium]|nr:hypothetical protein [Oscillospiraceae bacterium]